MGFEPRPSTWEASGHSPRLRAAMQSREAALSTHKTSSRPNPLRIACGLLAVGGHDDIYRLSPTSLRVSERGILTVGAAGFYLPLAAFLLAACVKGWAYADWPLVQLQPSRQSYSPRRTFSNVSRRSASRRARSWPWAFSCAWAGRTSAAYRSFVSTIASRRTERYASN
jgi:hypothetical protein